MTGRRLFRFTTFIILALLLAALPAGGWAQAEATAEPSATEEAAATQAAAVITVTGTISNGTAGATVPADLTVTLRIISPEMAETTVTATAGADGTFRLDDVVVYPDHVYVTTTEYLGSEFSSPLLRGSQLQAAPDLSIILYEFTDNPSALAVELLQAQLAVSLNELQVLELYRFTNTGDRAYRAADGASVRVTIPEGAQIFDMGSARFLVSEDGRQMIDTVPVLPGLQHTVHVLFTMPYGGEATVMHPVDYPLVNGFEALIDTNGLTVSGEGVEALGGREQGMAFGVPASIPAGGTVSFTIAGIPVTEPAAAVAAAASASTANAPQVPVISIILMILGGACVGIAIVLFLRERRRPAAPAANASDPRVAELVQEIAELDVAFQSGKLAQADYDAQRRALKAELMKLARHRAEN